MSANRRPRIRTEVIVWTIPNAWDTIGGAVPSHISSLTYMYKGLGGRIAWGFYPRFNFTTGQAEAFK